MADTKKGGRSGASKSGTGRGNGKGSRAKGKSAGHDSPGVAIWQGLLQIVFMTFLGRVFLALTGAAILIGINLLFTGDRFDTFYFLCAIEIIAFVAVGWLRLLLRPDND